MSPLVVLDNLSVAYSGTPAVSGLSLAIGRGEAYGLVGESGSGKSTIAMAIMRYLAAGGRVTGGRVLFDGDDMMALDAAALRAFRGQRAAMVYQNPGAALDPSMTVGDQVAEVFTAHGALPAAETRQKSLDMLRQVQLTDAESVSRRFPHQLSGGMQQRVVIAMALAARPDLLILDEPTTGLDATVEAAILALLADLRRQLSLSVLLISHNLAVVAEVCDRVGVLYAGRLVEEGPVEDVFEQPSHPYTRGLLASLPVPESRKGAVPIHAIGGQPLSAASRLDGCTFAPRCPHVRPECSQAEPALLDVTPTHSSRCFFWEEVLAGQAPPLSANVHQLPVQRTSGAAPDALLTADDIHKVFRVGGERTVALDGVSIQLRPGKTLGLVGESGSGKSTLARVIAGLEPLDAGALSWRGQPLDKSVQKRGRAILRQLQMVFQDPDSTLNPRHTVRTLLERSIRRLTDLDTPGRQQRARDLLAAVDLEPRYLDSRPGELSGGQRQRVAIARAFAGAPALVLCDEPTSALDASVQANILNLLDRLQNEQGTAYLFISHDIGVVRYLADLVGVLYLGRLMQLGSADAFFGPPFHPYTEMLLASVPGRNRQHQGGTGGTTRVRPTRGCPFQLTCPRTLGSVCETETPPWRATTDGGGLLCHIPLAELAAAQAN